VDVHRKATEEKDPFLGHFNAEVDEFFTAVRDTEINRFIGDVKRNMLARIQAAEPLHPDDWEPTSAF
jgi:hypothetical protein